MRIDINTSSPEPIYRQIAQQIKRAVAIRGLSPGEPLPSVRELAQRLVVNPNTVFRAYGELEREGIVHSRPRVGTFVAERAAHLNAAEKRRILSESADRLITEAAHLGVSEEELVEVVRQRASAFSLSACSRSEGQNGE